MKLKDLKPGTKFTFVGYPGTFIRIQNIAAPPPFDVLALRMEDWSTMNDGAETDVEIIE